MFHVVSFSDGTAHVTDVWESAADFERFMQERSGAAAMAAPWPPAHPVNSAHAQFLCVLTLSMAASGLAQDWAKKKVDASPRHHEWVESRTAAAPSALRRLSRGQGQGAGRDRDPRDLRHERLGADAGRRTRRSRLHRHRARPAVRHGPERRRHEQLHRPAPRRQSDPRSSARPDHRRSERRSPITSPNFPAANGKVAVDRILLGRHAVVPLRHPAVRASPPRSFSTACGPESPDDIAKIKAPVYGFYAGNDARIGATIPKRSN